MCSIFYPGEIVLENASCYPRDRSAHTAKRMCPTEHCTTGETPRARTRAKVVISCILLLVTQITVISGGLTQEGLLETFAPQTVQ